MQAPLALTLGGKAFTSSTVDVELSAGAKRPCALLPETARPPFAYEALQNKDNLHKKHYDLHPKLNEIFH